MLHPSRASSVGRRFHYCCRFISGHPISVKLTWDLEIRVSLLCELSCMLQAQAVLLLVCAQSPEVYCKGRHVLCVCIAVRRVQNCFLPLQTSCVTLLPASIAQVLVTSRLAPHFTATPSQQDGSQMKYKSISELKKIKPLQVMEAGHTKKSSCCQ